MRWAWPLVLVVAAAGCSRCSKGAGSAAGPQVERVLPKGAAAVVVIPSVKESGAKVQRLQGLKIAGFVAQLQGFADGNQLADALVSQLGLDVRSEKALAQAGVDAARPLGVVVQVSRRAYLALPVKDEQALHTTLENLSYRRLGAGAAAEKKVGDVTIHTFSPQQGTPPRLSYALAHGYALVAALEAQDDLPAAASLAQTDSLVGDATWEAAKKALTGKPDAIVFVPHGSLGLQDLPVSSMVVTLGLERDGLALELVAPWRGDARQLAALTPVKGVELAGLLPRDAFVLARVSGDASALSPFADAIMGPYLGRAFKEGGFDVRTEVLENLKPGAVASLSLAPRPPMDQGLPELDIRRTNPFTYVHLAGAAPVKRPEAVVPTLEKVAALGPRFGAELRKSERDSTTVFTTRYAQGEGVHLGLKDDRLLFASPLTRLDGLLQGDLKAAPPVAGLEDGAFSLVIDLQKLASSVRELPSEAWGIGGFAIKATTVRWLEATDDLRAVSVSVGARGNALHLKARLALSPPPEPAAR